MEISASINAIILIAAAGSGQRAGGEIPKQYHKIGSKAVLRHTIEAFLAVPGFNARNIKIIIDPAHRPLYEQAIEGLESALPPPVHGGPERMASIYNGLKACHGQPDDAVILIHDGARPFISAADIIALAEAAATHKAATLATRLADTVVQDKGDSQPSYPDRRYLWALQTPQGFHYGLILKAHEQAAQQEEAAIYTDDTALVASLGVQAHLVEGRRDNFKITTADDLVMAEKLMDGQQNRHNHQYEYRTGSGFDVHAFDKTTPGPLRLCGIDVPHERCLTGHSDADVGLHALTDALLGTVAAGDIGFHFPPSDPQWKGKDSAFFLQRALEIVRDKGGAVIHCDITLICETPKIGPHRPAMQERLASLLALPVDRISIKATTTEKLGFTGRSEGIAVQAVATIRL